MSLISIRNGVTDLSEFSLIEAAKCGGCSDLLPSEDENVIYLYDAIEDRFVVGINEDADEVYDTFQNACMKYMKKAYKRHSPYRIEFPRGCFTTDELDEPCEDFGDLLVVWKYNKLYLIIQMQNPQYI